MSHESRGAQTPKKGVSGLRSGRSLLFLPIPACRMPTATKPDSELPAVQAVRSRLASHKSSSPKPWGYVGVLGSLWKPLGLVRFLAARPCTSQVELNVKSFGLGMVWDPSGCKLLVLLVRSSVAACCCKWHWHAKYQVLLGVVTDQACKVTFIWREPFCMV